MLYTLDAACLIDVTCDTFQQRLAGLFRVALPVKQQSVLLFVRIFRRLPLNTCGDI